MHQASPNTMSYFATSTSHWISGVGRYQEKETTENLAVHRKIFVNPKTHTRQGSEPETEG